jgi:hypothetical protein
MQFPVGAINLGYEAATYLTKYPGRFLSLHLADWPAAEKKQIAIGAGQEAGSSLCSIESPVAADPRFGSRGVRGSETGGRR